MRATEGARRTAKTEQKIFMADTTASCRSICSSVGIALRGIVIHSCPQKHFVKGMTIGAAKG
jgi:hypothetical protein